MDKGLANRELQPARTAGNENTGLLKLIALVFMFCDHAGKMLCGNMLEMRLIGRIAFPIYAWALVVGACWTRSMWKYVLRILLVGVISQVPYMLALSHGWADFNIFLTLALGLVGIWGVRTDRWGSRVWAPLLALAMAVVLAPDYGWRGVLFILLLYAARTSRPAIVAVMIAFCLFWGATSTTVSSLFGIRLSIPAPWNGVTGPFLHLQTFALLALPFILYRDGNRLRLPTWVGYAIYPAHLLLLLLLEKVL